MNQTAVRNAYSSSTLLAAQVTFSWNAAGTIFDHHAQQPPPVRVRRHPDAPGDSVHLRRSRPRPPISRATVSPPHFRRASRPCGASPARSREPTFSTFSTARPTVHRRWGQFVCTESQDLGNTVGRSVSLAFTSVRKLYITLQIPAAPTGVTAVETAVCRGLQTKVSGNPYSLSVMTADEIPFQANPGATSNTVAPIRSLGTFSTTASTVAPQVNVTATFAQWFTSGGGRRDDPTAVRRAAQRAGPGVLLVYRLPRDLDLPRPVS